MYSDTITITSLVWSQQLPRKSDLQDGSQSIKQYHVHVENNCHVYAKMQDLISARKFAS